MTSLTARAASVARIAFIAVVASVALPSRGRAQEPRVAQAPDTTLQSRPPRRSWTSDRREFAVGDLLTVLVDESTLASASTDNNATSTRSRDLSLGAGGTSNGKALGGTDVSFSSANNAQSAQRGGATRENQFTSELSVRVTAVDPAGRLQVRGRKLVNVDRNIQEITLTGWVRPEDVSAYNTISSARVADAELVYAAKGKLGKPHSGIIGRILGALWP
jgi:flagellar L-ring protein precursor FlgH